MHFISIVQIENIASVTRRPCVNILFLSYKSKISCVPRVFYFFCKIENVDNHVYFIYFITNIQIETSSPKRKHCRPCVLYAFYCYCTKRNVGDNVYFISIVQKENVGNHVYFMSIRQRKDNVGDHMYGTLGI